MNDEYAVSDLGVASYLLTGGKTLLRLDRANPRRIQFVFKRTQEIERDVEQYWNGAARVAPLALQLCQKALKARIYSNQQA
jgi:hypothetical protein